MNEVVRSSEPQQDDISAQVIDVPSQWESLQGDLTRLSVYAFQEGAIRGGGLQELEGWIARNFRNENPHVIRVVLKKKEKVLGFSVAHSDIPGKEMVITNT